MNILTFDVEEWFHLLDFDATRGEEQWGQYEVRIYENVERILNLLEETNTRATFFVIGWVAKTYPDLVRKIAEKYDNVTIVDGFKLVPHLPEYFLDKLHPNCLGCEWYGRNLVEEIRKSGF